MMEAMMANQLPDELSVIVRHEDGSYWATVKEFPGVFATGDTLEELRASLEEGIALYLSTPGREVAVQLGELEPEPSVAHPQLAYA
jgi:predicted RNase H-like HicB family nuclease